MKFSAHFGNFIVQILRLSLTADIDLLDEAIRNCKLCNTINLREAEVCPSKISHKWYKQSLFIFLQYA